MLCDTIAPRKAFSVSQSIVLNNVVWRDRSTPIGAFTYLVLEGGVLVVVYLLRSHAFHLNEPSRTAYRSVDDDRRDA